ncbi:Tubulin polyglutamylase ttll4 [Entophlyctis sp. JEL0112]|nr:Tubulin polyglutamylase ttll4 [Entophlyctis sp. JEL0112]
MRHFSFNPGDNLLFDLTESELKVLKEVEDEFHRRGNFERIFPTFDSGQYFKLFTSQPYYDCLVFQWIRCLHDDSARAYNMLQKLTFANIYSPTTSTSAKTRKHTSSTGAEQVFSPLPKPVRANPPKVTPSLQNIAEAGAAGDFPLNQPPVFAPTIRKHQPSPPRISKIVHSKSQPAPPSSLQAIYPERQTIPIRTSVLTASAAGIAPCLHSEYILKPKKLPLRKIPAPPALQSQSIISEFMASLIALEMQQNMENSAETLVPTNILKKYPSTSAYTAAMAIAHVTAKIREENQISITPFESLIEPRKQ